MGLYEYTVLPMGLINAPSSFQRLMNHVLRKGLNAFCTVYLDDILVFSRTPEEHADHLRQVFAALRENHLHVKRSKCSFGRTSIEYLGHVVSGAGVSPDPGKVDVIKTWP